MAGLKLKKEDLILSWVFIYMISKILWDKIPGIFEGTFFIFIVWQTLNFFYVRKKLKIYYSDKEILLFLFFTFYIILNGLFKDSVGEFFRAIYEYLFYVLQMYAFIYYRNKVDLPRCLKTVSVTGFVISALSWYEYFTQHYLLNDLSNAGIILNVDTYGFRAAVFTRSFISHGMVLGIICLIGYYLWMQTTQKRWIFNAGFAFVSIITTGSRGPLVSVSAGIAVAYFLNVFYIDKTRRKKNTFVFISIIIAIIALIVFTVPIKSVDSFITYSIYRVQSIFNWDGDAGNLGRLRLWNEAIKNWFLQSPIWGIGPSKTGSWSTTTLGVTESGVLRRLCEFGIVGFVIYYSFVFSIVKKSIMFMEELAIEKKREIVLWISICVAIFINDITVQTTEEIMVSFWWWISLGGIYLIKNYAIQDKTKIQKDNCGCKSGQKSNKTVTLFRI